MWQLNRAAQKQHMIERFKARSDLAPLSLQAIKMRGDDVADYPLVLEGNFMNEKNFLLDNRIMNGHAGYSVITPFFLDNEIVLVDRGWLPADQNRKHLPSIPADGRQRITGFIYLPPKNAFTLRDDDYTHVIFPMLIQKLDLPKSQQLLAARVLPFVLRQTDPLPTPLKRDMPVAQMDPAKHYGYAFQWFAMAIAVVLITIKSFYSRQRNSPSPLPQERA